MKRLAVILLATILLGSGGIITDASAACRALDAAPAVTNMCGAEHVAAQWLLQADLPSAALPALKRFALAAPMLAALIPLVALAIRTPARPVIHRSDRLPRGSLYRPGLFLPYLYATRAP